MCVRKRDRDRGVRKKWVFMSKGNVRDSALVCSVVDESLSLPLPLPLSLSLSLSLSSSLLAFGQPQVGAPFLHQKQKDGKLTHI